jgi:uncharacterized protein (DUF1330 family)
MRPLRYSINVTLDGCCDHRAIVIAPTTEREYHAGGQMTYAYLVGHITIVRPDKWAEYTRQVPDTLAPWGAELVFRGKQIAALAGQNPHADIVVIRFPNLAVLNQWFSSPAYQALIPLREQAAEVVLLSYEG